MRKKTFSAFLKEARGSVATIGAVAISVAVGAVALSVTAAHVFETRADVQRALDAALLSAARSMDYDNPQPMVQRFLEAYVRDAGIPAKNILVDAHYDDKLGVLIGNVKFRVDAIFPIPSRVDDHMRPRVASQVTPQGSSRLELAFALDMSGSMEELLPDGRTTRIEGLRSALNDLFHLIGAEQAEDAMTNKGEERQVLVSIVPYATSVNIGNLYKAVGSGSLRGNAPASQAGPSPHAFFAAPKASDAEYRKEYYGVKWGCDARGRNCAWDGEDRETVTKPTALNPNPTDVADHLLRGVWATERIAPTVAGGGRPVSLDAAPRDEMALKYASYKDVSTIMRERLRRQNPGATVSDKTFHRTWATPIMHPLPLTDDLNQLRAYAKNLTAYGGTAGHIGMEWAWYSIAPSWGGVWAYRPTNAKGEFQRVESILPEAAVQGLLDNLLDGVGQTVGGVLDLVGGLLGGAAPPPSSFVKPQLLPAPYDAYKTTKVIVMMTDGLFNPPLNTGGVGTSSNDAYAYFQKICSAAKEKGVIIYTIAFSDGAEATDQLRSCASQANNFFETQDTSQLSTAFRKIFISATNMHVSR